jgi:hypothetical protein
MEECNACQQMIRVVHDSQKCCWPIISLVVTLQLAALRMLQVAQHFTASPPARQEQQYSLLPVGTSSSYSKTSN